MHTDLSPIFGTLDDKSYTVTKAPSTNSTMEKTYDMHNTTIINSATLVKKTAAKRDILTGKLGSDNRVPVTLPQKTQPSRLSPTSTGKFV